ncbi:flagellar hook-associated protein 3 [Acidaminobacter sp. JC074]|uniref:flagellar hook-associated protein FlgL n=1 Tax=Acidaminobacter sp. JC074 TaxID=2530199 RepID=UPI001F0FED62|nr:flagellar hook-associated protein 3 [Acidaminobacter sp. JC074]
MRVTSSMMIKTMNYNLQKNLTNMNDMYNQMSTGKSFNEASQNPVGAAKSIKYTSYLMEIEQYQANANDAVSRLSVTESSINSVEELLEKTRELTVQAANETLSDEDRLAILSEIGEIQEQLLEVGNATYAGESLFGGYNIGSQPFTHDSDNLLMYNDGYINLEGPYDASMSDADIEALYTLHAGEAILDDSSSENMIYHIGENSEVDVNVEGHELFGVGESSVFSVVDKIAMALEGKETYKVVENGVVVEKTLDLSDLIGEIDDSLEAVRSTKAEVGAKSGYVNMSLNRLNQDHYTYTALLSSNEDADIAQVSMYLANAETVYSASLSAGSKIIMPSLVDFIG